MYQGVVVSSSAGSGTVRCERERERDPTDGPTRRQRRLHLLTLLVLRSVDFSVLPFLVLLLQVRFFRFQHCIAFSLVFLLCFCNEVEVYNLVGGVKFSRGTVYPV